jgi:hypothetical protein
MNHLDLYMKSMEEIGADTKPMQEFLARLESGVH